MKNISMGISRVGLFCFLAVLVVSSIWGGQSNPISKIPELDGFIEKDEYSSAKIYKGSTGRKFTFYCKVVGPDLFIALEVETSGWVAIGIEPTDNLHKNADIILGWVDDKGRVKVVDAFSPEADGPHPEDKELGGTTDIKLYGGSEINGITTIEFVRP